MHIIISPLLLFAPLIALFATALPSPNTLSTHQLSTDPLFFNETTSLPYPFTLSAFLFSDPSNTLPFGFPRGAQVNTFGSLGLKSTFSLTDGKLKLVVKRREKGGDKLEKVEDLEVGAPALRQGVILLPAGQGVPVRVVKGGNETLVVEVDDEKVLADFAVARGFFKGGPLALADRKPFVNPGLVKFKVNAFSSKKR